MSDEILTENRRLAVADEEACAETNVAVVRDV